MVGPGLKLRYILAVLLVGALLTAVVATTTYLAERDEHAHLVAAERQLEYLAGITPEIDDAARQLRLVMAEGYDRRVTNIVIAGSLLTLVGAIVILLLMTRIDRALISLMDNARSIGRGLVAEPVVVSGVAEVAALERSLEQMRQALAATTISRDYLDDVVNGISDAVLVTSPEGRIQTANAAAGTLFGMPERELADVAFSDLVAREHIAAFNLERLKREAGETVVRTQLGQTIPVSVHVSPLKRQDGGDHGHILVLRDITDRKRAERRIRYLARFDTLTKMPNRLQFQHLLHQAITRSTRAGRGLVLLYVDIDNFKEVNDTFGHETGDRVLETLSERLTRVLPRDAVAGRLAGDEFAVFAEAIEGEHARHTQGGDLARLVLPSACRADLMRLASAASDTTRPCQILSRSSSLETSRSRFSTSSVSSARTWGSTGQMACAARNSAVAVSSSKLPNR